MARTITADPKKIQMAANSVEGLASEYEKQYKQLYNEIDIMASAWQGPDSVAATSKIRGYLADFQAMSSLMKQYAEFLKVSAKGYTETQDASSNLYKR